MGLFNTGFRRKPGTVSNTKLVVSGGDSPAEHWKVKQDLPKLFDYPYGGAGQTDVIVSKGMMVAIDTKTPLIKNYDTNRWTTQLTIADGKNPVVGMAPYNFCREIDNMLTGNQPAIITREYVELPYFPKSDDAKGCLWGNVSGDIEAGCLLKVSEDPQLNGRLVKWDPSKDTADKICAQVLAREPLGSDYDFLEWCMWDEKYKKEDAAYINKSGVSAPGMLGYPIDGDIYDKNHAFTRDEVGYFSKYTTTPTGIPGISDGANARNTEVNNKVGVVVDGTKKDTVVAYYVQPSLIPGTITATIGSDTIQEKDLDIDYNKGVIRYKLTKEATSNMDVTVKYKAYQYGTPRNMNFNGANGVVRLLLRF